MKNRIYIGLIFGIMSLSLVGCGGDKKTETKESETIIVETVAETFKTIGDETENENAFSLKVKNNTGLDITGVSIKLFDETEFPANMLVEDDTFAVNEERILYFADVDKETEETQSEDEKVMTPGYDIQITFADESVKVLHGFPFGDIAEGEICLEDEVAFVKYVSLSTGENVSTKDAELATKQAEEAAAQAVEEVYYEEDYWYEEDNSWYEEDDSWYEDDSSSWDDGSSGAADPVVPDAPAQDSDSCLGDGALTW